jgi:glucose/arabinose dehydrogenase
MARPSARHWRLAVLVLAFSAAVGAGRAQQQTLAPHEHDAKDAPPPILWATPPLPDHAVDFESAEERQLRLIVVARGLEQPWSVAFLPDGNMLVTERAGRLRLVRRGVLDPNPIAGVPHVQTGGPRGLQGLMDVALHPRFSENHWVYLAYHKSTGHADEGATTLARGTWNGTSLVGVRDIFESGAVGTEASRITFGRDGMLYMSISAPGSPNVSRAQDPNDYAGKVVRLRDDGRVPDDDPFVGRTGYKPAIFTMGHRNGHGLAVNPDTGELWETEQGPSGGDELNILRAGKNYGWPIISYGRDYWGTRVSRRPAIDGMEDPIVVWLPSIAITGMTFYTGDRFPHWRRSLFVGGLRQGGVPRTGQLQRVVFNERWEELRREPMLTDLHQRIRDVRQGPDGLLYVLTAEDEGALLRIEPR